MHVLKGRYMKDSREHHSLAFVRSIISLFFHKSIRLPVLGPVISLIPTLYGCESVPAPDCGFVVAGTSVTTKVAVLDPELTVVETMDILVFNDDELQRLDCYQRIEGHDQGTFMVSSQRGDKIMMFCANSQNAPEEWMWISSLPGLYRSCASLENETREAPVMSGHMNVTAGGTYSTQMKRLSAEIILRSLSCDFTGKPYDGEKLENVSVYLTNVNTETNIWEGGSGSNRFINQGLLNPADVTGFKDPSLVYADIAGSVGKEAVGADIALRCYPNISEHEGPGTPFTRLVIQGDIQGITWYWPIAVKSGRDMDGKDGVFGNRQYLYDICITGKGSADPDTEIEKGEIEIMMEVREWTEKEEYEVVF